MRSGFVMTAYRSCSEKRQRHSSNLSGAFAHRLTKLVEPSLLVGDMLGLDDHAHDRAMRNSVLIFRIRFSRSIR